MNMAARPVRHPRVSAWRVCIGLLLPMLMGVAPMSAPAMAQDGKAIPAWRRAAEERDAAQREVDFFRAILVDNDITMRRLLKEGVNPNLVGTDREEPGLVLSMRHDALRVFAELIAAPGIDLNARAPNGDSALMLAAYKGYEAQVRALLDKDAQLNHPGWTALHYAAAAGHTGIVRLLLERHAYIDAASPNGTTPLMMAARSGHLAVVELLLEEGADVRLINQAKFSAWDMADKFGYGAVKARLERQPGGKVSGQP